MDHDRGKDFKELCRAASNEMDPDKLMILVAEIIDSYDERERKRNPVREREKNRGQDTHREPPNGTYRSSCEPLTVGSNFGRYWS